MSNAVAVVTLPAAATPPGAGLPSGPSVAAGSSGADIPSDVRRWPGADGAESFSAALARVVARRAGAANARHAAAPAPVRDAGRSAREPMPAEVVACKVGLLVARLAQLAKADDSRSLIATGRAQSPRKEVALPAQAGSIGRALERLHDVAAQAGDLLTVRADRPHDAKSAGDAVGAELAALLALVEQIALLVAQAAREEKTLPAQMVGTLVAELARQLAADERALAAAEALTIAAEAQGLVPASAATIGAVAGIDLALTTSGATGPPVPAASVMAHMSASADPSETSSAAGPPSGAADAAAGPDGEAPGPVVGAALSGLVEDGAGFAISGTPGTARSMAAASPASAADSKPPPDTGEMAGVSGHPAALETGETVQVAITSRLGAPSQGEAATRGQPPRMAEPQNVAAAAPISPDDARSPAGAVSAGSDGPDHVPVSGAEAAEVSRTRAGTLPDAVDARRAAGPRPGDGSIAAVGSGAGSSRPAAGGQSDSQNDTGGRPGTPAAPRAAREMTPGQHRAASSPDGQAPEARAVAGYRAANPGETPIIGVLSGMPQQGAGTPVADGAAGQTPAAGEVEAQIMPVIVRQARLMATGNSHELTIRLEPRALGMVHVQLTLDDDGLSVRIRAASAETQRTLDAALPQLRATILDAGLRLAHLDASASNAGGDGRAPAGDWRGNGDGRGSGEPGSRPSGGEDQQRESFATLLFDGDGRPFRITSTDSAFSPATGSSPEAVETVLETATPQPALSLGLFRAGYGAYGVLRRLIGGTFAR